MRVMSGVALRNALFASASLIAVASPAFAADPVAIADELVAALGDDTRTATYETATADATGTVITITNLGFDDPPNGNTANVEEVVIANPVEGADGGFTADTITLRNATLSDSSNTVRVENAELTGVTVPAGGDLTTFEATTPMTGMVATGIVLEPPQANPINIERVEMTLGDIAEGVPYDVSVALMGLEVPLDLADDSEAIAVIRDLGFETLFMDFNVAGAFDADEDTVHVNSVGINIRDFGHIDLAGTITGIALGQLAVPGGPEEILAAAMVNDVRVRFENGGAMEAFLREQAELTNLTPEDVAYGLAAAFQIFLRTLENPTLEQQVGQAVGAFLRDPRSLTLVATPAEPVPLMEIVGLLMSAPTALPGLLNVIVTAND